MHFFNFENLRITLQSSDLIWGIKFCAPSPWSGVSSLSSFSITLPFIFQEAKESIDEEDPRPTSSNGAYITMVVSLFLTHLLLEVASPIIFLPSLFRCHWSSRSKGLHWWRRSKAYKLHMELHHVVSRASSSRWCSFASSIFLFGQFTLISCSSSYYPCIASIVLWFGSF